MRIICVSVCAFCVFVGAALSSNNLPVGYTELEYLQSTGGQWINTGVIPTLDYTVEVKAIKDTNFSLFGSGKGDYTFTGYQNQNYAYIGNYNASSGYFSVTCDNQEEPHIWEISNRTAYCDNNASSTSSYTTQPTFPLALYARTISATAVDTQSGRDDNGKHSIYYAKIYNELGTLIRNFIPARRNSDNILGMYDTVTNTFFTNSGTGTFIAGPAVPYIPDGYVGGVVDLGTLNWTYDTTTLAIPTFKAIISSDKQIGQFNLFINASGYTLSSTAYSVPSDKTYIGGSGSLYVYIRNDAYTDTTAFKNAMAGVFLYYQRTSDNSWSAPVFPIKIATTKYVESAFAESVSELNTTIGTIKSVVDNTIIQADRIGKLHTGKQTRPDEQCPKGRECLLITEPDGSLHWYPICDANGSVDPIE